MKIIDNKITLNDQPLSKVSQGIGRTLAKLDQVRMEIRKHMQQAVGTQTKADLKRALQALNKVEGGLEEASFAEAKLGEI